jgi:predicted transposase/invertase (TIGR01784 family)
MRKIKVEMAKNIGISATNDVIFKIILGDPKHTRLLIHFLNAAIKSETPLISVEITNNELTLEYVGQKGSRLNVKAKTQSGELINVEMQCGSEKHMIARALFYWSRIFAEQIEVSDQYYKLKQTISISILDLWLFNDERYWRKGHIANDVINENMNELLEIQFIQLSKLRQMEKESPIAFWIEFFRNPYSRSVKALCVYVSGIKEAKQIYEQAKSTPKARELIEIREKAVRDYSNDIAYAKDEGKAEGIAIGKEEGIAIDEEREKARGRREMAIRLLSIGLNVEQISEKFTLKKVLWISGNWNVF